MFSLGLLAVLHLLPKHSKAYNELDDLFASTLILTGIVDVMFAVAIFEKIGWI